MPKKKNELKAVVQAMLNSTKQFAGCIPQLIEVLVSTSGGLTVGIADYIWKRVFTFISCWSHKKFRISTVVADVESCLPLVGGGSVGEPHIRRILTIDMGGVVDPLVTSRKVGSETWFSLNILEIRTSDLEKSRSHS